MAIHSNLPERRVRTNKLSFGSRNVESIRRGTGRANVKGKIRTPGNIGYSNCVAQVAHNSVRSNCDRNGEDKSREVKHFHRRLENVERSISLR